MHLKPADNFKMVKKSSGRRIDFDKFGIYHSHRQARLTRPSESYDSQSSARQLFRLAKPPVGWGPLIAGTIAFVILINIFNVFLTISLAFGIGAAAYFLLPANRSRRWTNRAIREELMGNGDVALKMLKKSLSLNPKNTQARNLKGFILAGKEEYAEAAEELEKYFESAYDYNSVALLGRCYWKLGRLEEAIDLLKQLPKDNPRYIKSIVLLGRSYIRKGVPQRAINLLSQNLKSTAGNDPAEIEIRYALAEAYEAAKKIDEAIAQYLSILKKRKEDKQTAARISFLLKTKL